MKRYFAAALFLFLVHATSAQTNVSGFINANTTWTLAGSPYLVTGNALLSQGYTLTIDPGVVVKFDNNKALQIDGELIAIGTVSQHIVFTSNQAVPQPGDWAKLHFSDFSTDAVYNAAGNYVSGTIMKYCDVRYAGSLMWGSIDIQQCSPYFNHCRILDGSWSGINFNGDHLTIDSSSVRNCAKRGIYYQGGNFLMRNDSFSYNLEGAIHVIQTYNGIQSRIVDSYFRWNYGAISWQNNGLQYVTIKNCAFVNNNGPAVVALQGVGDTVICNKFKYNTNGPAIQWSDWGYPWSGGLIHNNLIEYNSNAAGPSVFLIGSGYSTDTLFISNNTVRHNSSPGNSCSAYYFMFGVTPRCLQIYNNSFTENDGINFMLLNGTQNNDPSFDFMYLNNNTFFNPACQYELNNSILYGSPNLLIANNYWGSSSTAYVDGAIYDYFDFANQSVAYYMPILTSPVAVDTACLPFQKPLGMDESHAITTSKLELFPNPTNGSFTINFGDEHQPSGGIIEIRNSLSELVYRDQLPTDGSTSFTLPEATSGIYFVRVVTKERIWMGRIVKI
ncbi:MAG: T9SS type A sorting domain-containing protein [Bacteroidia bacterium]